MSFNSIRKILFTNKFSERIFLKLIQRSIFPEMVVKLIASNHLYDKPSLRVITRNGIRYSLDISDYQAWLIYFMSDQDTSFELLKYLGNAQLIFDIGGNIGQTSLEINRNRRINNIQCKIIAFEPFPETYAKFQHNLKLNPEMNEIIVENLGIGNVQSEALMFQDCETNSGGNRMVYDALTDKSKTRKVKITTLDHYVKTHGLEKVNFIKIDIEGYEYSALQGAIETLKRDKPRLYIELDSKNLKMQGSSSAELLLLLKSLGYNVKDVKNRYSYEELSTLDVHTDIYCE